MVGLSGTERKAIMKAVKVGIAAVAMTCASAASGAAASGKVQQTELKCVGKFSEWKMKSMGYAPAQMDFPLFLSKNDSGTLGFTISAVEILSAIWVYDAEFSSSYKMQFKTDNDVLTDYGLKGIVGMQKGNASLDRESGAIYMNVEHDAGTVTFTGTCARAKLQF
jgi:hypothetical protein